MWYLQEELHSTRVSLAAALRDVKALHNELELERTERERERQEVDAIWDLAQQREASLLWEIKKGGSLSDGRSGQYAHEVKHSVIVALLAHRHRTRKRLESLWLRQERASAKTVAFAAWASVARTALGRRHSCSMAILLAGQKTRMHKRRLLESVLNAMRDHAVESCSRSARLMKLEAACVKHRVRVLAYVLAVWSCDTLQGVKSRLHSALKEALDMAEALSSKATRKDALAQAYQALLWARARRAAGQKRLGLAFAAWLECWRARARARLRRTKTLSKSLATWRHTLMHLVAARRAADLVARSSLLVSSLTWCFRGGGLGSRSAEEDMRATGGGAERASSYSRARRGARARLLLAVVVRQWRQMTRMSTTCQVLVTRTLRSQRAEILKASLQAWVDMLQARALAVAGKVGQARKKLGRWVLCAWLGQTRVMRGWKTRQQVAAASWQRARQCRCKRAWLEMSFKGWQWSCRAVKSRRAIVAGLSQERALQRQGAFLFALLGLTRRRRLCKHRLRHLCERKQACTLSALFAAWASLVVARKQVRILCCPRAASVAVHGSRVLTWLLLFCNKRERGPLHAERKHAMSYTYTKLVAQAEEIVENKLTQAAYFNSWHNLALPFHLQLPPRVPSGF